MEIVLIVVLTLLNGAFAMSEMAISASRRTRLVAMSEAGDRGATKAIELMDSPTRFLSTVQIGITSIGMLNGIVGEAAFSDGLALWLVALGVGDKAANWSATAIVVVIITFTTIIFGELVPKRIGQIYPELVARWIALPMAMLAKAASPFVRLLSGVTASILKLLNANANSARDVTEDEIQASLREGVDAGVIEASEHQMVRNVFHLDDRDLSSLMVPREKIVAVDATDSIAECSHRLAQSGHTWFPVVRGDLDDIAGVVSLHQLLGANQGETTLAEIAQTATFVPETLTGMELLEQFRLGGTRMVFVVDEYGIVQGMLTVRDLLEAITGELKPRRVAEAWIQLQDDDSLLVDARMPIAEFKTRLGISTVPGETMGRFSTVAGLVVAMLGRLTQRGDVVDLLGWQVMVHKVNGRRLDQVVVRRRQL